MKRALALLALSGASFAYACSAEIEDVNACHYVARRACDRLAACSSAPSSCVDDLRDRCQRLQTFDPDKDELRMCGDAIENAACAANGIELPASCLDPPAIRYLWSEPTSRDAGGGG